jgi:hypothetical protein
VGSTPRRVLALAERGDIELTGPREVETIAELEDALPDLRAVHDRAIADGDLVTVARLAGRLYRFAYAQARGDVLAWGGRLAEDDADRRSRRSGCVPSPPASLRRCGTTDIEEAVTPRAMYADHLDDAATDPWSGITLAETSPIST